MTFIKINETLYPATITGRITDNDWDKRESKSIKLEMDYATAIKLFVDGLAWSIVQQNEEQETEYDNSEFCVAGDIVDHRNGSVTVKMGKPTDTETLLELLYGGVE